MWLPKGGHEGRPYRIRARIVRAGLSAYNSSLIAARPSFLPAMYLLYSMLFTMGAILTAPYYLLRPGRARGSGYWSERFGKIPYKESSAGAIWVHAVSLGETLAVAGLVQEIQRRYPDRRIYLSHVTPAGREAGKKRLPSIAGRFYLPLDWRWTARKALASIRPSLLVVVETEIWPNLLRAAREAGSRVVIVNARLSTRSFNRYRLVSSFLRRVLAGVDEICAQTEEDGERFRLLGAPPECVRMTGNLKFDAKPPQLGDFARALKAALKQTERSPVIVAASTMPGEEPPVFKAWDAIRRRHPKSLLILAPRHPARVPELVEQMVRELRGFARRTTLPADTQALATQLQSKPILILDTVGELAGVFEVADVVFMGGSLVPTGGHNLLEPAYWSKPIIIGPHMENFREIARRFLDADAAIQVNNAQELAQAAQRLEDPAERERLGAAARKVLDQNSGATARTLDALQNYLERNAHGQAPLPREGM